LGQRDPGSSPLAPPQVNVVTIDTPQAPPARVTHPTRLEHDPMESVLNDLNRLPRLRPRRTTAEDDAALGPLWEEVDDVFAEQRIGFLDLRGPGHIAGGMRSEELRQ